MFDREKMEELQKAGGFLENAEFSGFSHFAGSSSYILLEALVTFG